MASPRIIRKTELNWFAFSIAILTDLETFTVNVFFQTSRKDRTVKQILKFPPRIQRHLYPADGMEWLGEKSGERAFSSPPREKVTTCRRSPFRQDTRHFSDSGNTVPLLKMFMTFTPFTYANEQEAGFSAPAHTMRATP